MQQGRWPELPPTEDAAATIAALRLLRAKIATLRGTPATFTIPVIGGDPVPPGLRAVIATLTDLAASALPGHAGLSETETEAQVRDRILYYLDTVIELATQQALARPEHALVGAAPVFDVVVACPGCGTRRNLRGTEPEIAAAGEIGRKDISAPPTPVGGAQPRRRPAKTCSFQTSSNAARRHSRISHRPVRQTIPRPRPATPRCKPWPPRVSGSGGPAEGSSGHRALLAGARRAAS